MSDSLKKLKSKFPTLEEIKNLLTLFFNIVTFCYRANEMEISRDQPRGPDPLQGLRGLAALHVMFFHFNLNPTGMFGYLIAPACVYFLCFTVLCAICASQYKDNVCD